MLNRFLRAGRKRLARSPLFPAATGANKGPGRGMPPGEKRGLRLTGRVLRAAGVPSGAAPDNTPWDFEVRIATPGYSHEGRWFLSREVLREAAPLFEGAQAFANHAEGGAPDIRALVGWHRNVRMVESDLHSTFAVARSAGWFQALAQDALARGIEEPFGFSFDVVAQTEYREEEGGLVLHFQKIVAVNSVDVVHKGRLGGGLLDLAAADRPDTEVVAMEKLFRKLRAAVPEAAARLGGRWTRQQLISACERAGLDSDLAQKGDAMENENPHLIQSEEEAMQQEIGSLQESLRAAESRDRLTCRLAESPLPEPVKEKVRTQFTGRVCSGEEIDEALRLESSALEKLTASGALKGFGRRAEVVRDEIDRKKAALDGLWESSPTVRDGHRPYRFLGEAFQDFTGHRLTPHLFFAETFHYHRAAENWNGIRRLSAALDTSTWGEAFGDSIRRALLRDFRDDRFQLWRKIVSAIVPVKDFRTNRRIRVGGYGDLQAVSEQATYPTLASPTDEEVTYAVSKRGGIEDLTWEMIQNDDMGSIRLIPRRLARAAQRTLNNFVFGFLASATNIYDGVALFHANHNNTSTNVLTYANVITGIKSMGQQTFYGESGVEMASQVYPKYLLHPTELLEEAFDITQSAVKVISGENSTQPSVINRLGVEPLWVPELTDANNWYLAADPLLVDTVEIGFLEDMQDPELFVEDNPLAGSGFNADKVRYKIRHVYGGAVLDYRGFYRGAPA